MVWLLWMIMHGRVCAGALKHDYIRVQSVSLFDFWVIVFTHVFLFQLPALTAPYAIFVGYIISPSNKPYTIASELSVNRCVANTPHLHDISVFRNRVVGLLCGSGRCRRPNP
ncbi:hypothetical protein M8C21_009828 [Ambrosia artemisiifolia]|uniref:Secreted peptide n=1 Tax=Ambrosia artemisiifolia TaxID=4212 RepID=A0AAD5GBQ3_AMBAR|nr:hypothetical protein M8C21_009828 [Ambrosia artemisiifolia]